MAVSLDYPLQLVFNTQAQAETALLQYNANIGCQSWDSIRQRDNLDNKYFFQVDMDNISNLRDIQNIYEIGEYSPTWMIQEF